MYVLDLLYSVYCNITCAFFNIAFVFIHIFIFDQTANLAYGENKAFFIPYKTWTNSSNFDEMKFCV